MNLSQSLVPEEILVETIYAEMDKAIRSYLDREGFLKVRAPFLSEGMGSCENPETLFKAYYLGRRSYLRQSGQLYLEMYMPFFEKVWCEGPSFRSEHREDERHLPEFNLYEFEFRGNFQQLLVRIENLIFEIVRQVVLHKEAELVELGVDVQRLRSVRTPFPRITYENTTKVLALKGDSDFSSEHEKTLVKLHGFQPLFITHFPENMKFFNMKVNRKNPWVVNSADLILPFSGEAVGAAEREFQYNLVSERLRRSAMLEEFQDDGVVMDNFKPYLNILKDEGSVLHSGCGIGVERVLQFLLGASDIRKASPFALLHHYTY